MRLLGHGTYPPDVVEEAREKLRKGDFRRQIIARTPRDMYWDDVLLYCGHSDSAISNSSLTMDDCQDCADDWMRAETERRGKV